MNANSGSPIPVLSAFLARTIEIYGLSIAPLTLRRWFALEEARSPFVGNEWPEDRIETLQALCAAIGIFTERNFSLDDLVACCEPENVENIIAAIYKQIGIGFSTALAMKDRKESPSEKNGKEEYDPFGWPLRLLTYVCERFTLEPDVVLNTPLAQLFAIVATAYGIEGKVPAAVDYRGKKP